MHASHFCETHVFSGAGGQFTLFVPDEDVQVQRDIYCTLFIIALTKTASHARAHSHTHCQQPHLAGP